MLVVPVMEGRVGMRRQFLGRKETPEGEGLLTFYDLDLEVRSLLLRAARGGCVGEQAF